MEILRSSFLVNSLIKWWKPEKMANFELGMVYFHQEKFKSSLDIGLTTEKGTNNNESVFFLICLDVPQPTF